MDGQPVVDSRRMAERGIYPRRDKGVSKEVTSEIVSVG